MDETRHCRTRYQLALASGQQLTFWSPNHGRPQDGLLNVLLGTPYQEPAVLLTADHARVPKGFAWRKHEADAVGAVFENHLDGVWYDPNDLLLILAACWELASPRMQRLAMRGVANLVARQQTPPKTRKRGGNSLSQSMLRFRAGPPAPPS